MTPTSRRALIASAFALTAVAASPALAADPPPQPITEAEVMAAAEVWGKGLVSVSLAYNQDERNFEKAKAAAIKFIDDSYGYGWGPVLFKPTQARDPYTFRLTSRGALSYFVGHDRDEYPYDDGFALKPWRSATYTPVGIQINGAVAITMGKLELRDKVGQPTVVDKTWVFKKEKGLVRIILHHSSEPYIGY